MQAATVKLVSAAVIAMLAVTGISVIGFTADSVDARTGEGELLAREVELALG